MFVSEIKVRLMRRVQTEPYCPYEAAVEMAFQVEDGEAADKATADAINATKAALKACFPSGKAQTVAAPAKGVVTEQTINNEPVAQTPPRQAGTWADPITDDIPEPTPKAEKPKRGRAKKADAPATVTAAPEVSAAAGPDPEPEAPPSNMPKDGAEFQSYLISLVSKGRVNPETVKTKLYPKYGVARALDLKIEQIPGIFADLEAIAKPAAPETDISSL